MGLEFSALQLLIDQVLPKDMELEPAFTQAEDKYTSQGTHYLISSQKLDDNYFWLCARYGKEKPYSAKVFNIKDKTEEDNPRRADQIEPAKQLFALYCIHSHTLYLSNRRKESWVAEYLKSKLHKDVVIKSFLINSDEFIKKLKTVEKLKLVKRRNLFGPPEELLNIFPPLNDMWGLGVAEDFTFEANFAHASITKAFTNFFNKIYKERGNCKIDSLVCVGRDDKGFEAVFNGDSFVQKICVDAPKDDQGCYDSDRVRQALISKIMGLNDENS